MFFLVLFSQTLWMVRGLSRDWLSDSDHSELISKGECDFSRFVINKHPHRDDGTALSAWELDYPVILSNLTNEWLAHKKWNKTSFIGLYGDKSIRVGSESSIVYSGGVAENFMKLKDILDLMEAKDERSFVFDTTILRNIPELRSDFDVPPMFTHWDYEEVESQQQLWHMLSLGPSNAGLPFHHHGRTWLAVIHGAKRWFIYPPGYGPPPEIDQTFNPLQPMSEWLDTIYPQLLSYPKPPLYAYDIHSVTAAEEDAKRAHKPTGYRPLECIQRPGEILYLPNRWFHMTLNAGETIAIGGQELLRDDERIEGATAALHINPDNFEALKDLGMTVCNHATGARERFKNSLVASPNGLIHLFSRQDFESKLHSTRDSWLVFYFHNSTYTDHAELEHQLVLMDEIAHKLHGALNVATMDLTMQLIDQYTNVPVYVDADTGVSHYDLPFLKLHRGEPDKTDYGTTTAAGGGAAGGGADADAAGGGGSGDTDIEYTIDHVGVIFYPESVSSSLSPLALSWEESLAVDSDEVETFVYNHMDAANFSFTSAATTVSRAELVKYYEGIDHLRHALEVKPHHPETLCILCEMIAETHSDDELLECTNHAASVFALLSANQGVSKTALSSLHHRLARTHFERGQNDEAIPLLTTSVTHNPHYQTALYDLTVLHIRRQDRANAEAALAMLKRNVPGWRNIDSIDIIEREVAALV